VDTRPIVYVGDDYSWDRFQDWLKEEGIAMPEVTDRDNFDAWAHWRRQSHTLYTNLYRLHHKSMAEIRDEYEEYLSFMKAGIVKAAMMEMERQRVPEPRLVVR